MPYEFIIFSLISFTVNKDDINCALTFVFKKNKIKLCINMDGEKRII